MIQGLQDTHFDQVRSWAEKRIFVLGIWIFGSRAKGNAGPMSDLDLAVLTEHRQEGMYTPLIREDVDELVSMLALPYPVHCQVTHPDMGEIVVWPAVLDHGKQVYERSSQ